MTSSSSSPPPTPAPSPTPISIATLSQPKSSLPSLTPFSQSPPISKDSWQYVARSLIAGGLAGCVAKSATAPLDRVKVLFQGANPAFVQFTGHWFGPFRAVHHIYKTEGIYGLYKGHGATLLRIFPYAALNYMCYEQYKRILVGDIRPGHEHQPLFNWLPQPIARLLSGSLAGMTSVLCTYPLDYVHSRLAYQVHGKRSSGMIVRTLYNTFKQDGIKGIYRGFGPTVLGIMPYAGVSFFTYDTLKQLATTHNIGVIENHDPTKTEQLDVRTRLVCGALAGAAAQTAAYPFDVIRRQMQLHGLNVSLPKYRHTIDAVKVIWQQRGFRGLYIGLSINYFKVWPNHALSFTSYEYFKHKLNIS